MTDIKRLLQECQTGLDSHQRTKQVIDALVTLMAKTSSTAEVGRLLVEAIGNEGEIKEYLQHLSDSTVAAITTWYMAARLEILENQGEKK